MPSTSDRDWLKAKLVEPSTGLHQFGWTVEFGHQPRTDLEFVHGRHRSMVGIDECLVTANFDNDGRLELARYALPRGVPEWVQCDEAAFAGFLARGESGLDEGSHIVRFTECRCNKKRHRSILRAEAFARKVAQEAGTSGLQRAYRCVWNPRSVHLSSKERNSGGREIPGAYVVLDEGWNT